MFKEVAAQLPSSPYITLLGQPGRLAGSEWEVGGAVSDSVGDVSWKKDGIVTG